MFICPITKQKISFSSKDELLDYLSKLNPAMMRNFKEQYKAKYPNYEILGFGKEVKIIKISKKDPKIP